MVGVTIISTHVVVIPTSSDWVTITPTSCFQVSTTVAFDMIGETMLI
jgi:uncharacterized protein YaiE (UPF0345 family)